MATVPTILTAPILVANLPLPPDIVAFVDRHWRSCRFTKRERAFLEEDIRLSLYYAGHYVVATAGSHGLEIHAIDLDNPDEIHELKTRLREKGYHHILSLYPPPWKDPDVAIVTLNPQS
jgi:hypothetical protein